MELEGLTLESFSHFTIQTSVLLSCLVKATMLFNTMSYRAGIAPSFQRTWSVSLGSNLGISIQSFVGIFTIISFSWSEFPLGVREKFVAFGRARERKIWVSQLA